MTIDPALLSKRVFIRTKQAWYADPVLVGEMYRQEEFMLSFDTAQDEIECPEGELAVRWDETICEPRLEAYHDTWHLLPLFADVLASLEEAGRQAKLGPDEFQAILVAAGLSDATQRQAPKDLRGKIEILHAAHAAGPR